MCVCISNFDTKLRGTREQRDRPDRPPARTTFDAKCNYLPISRMDHTRRKVTQHVSRAGQSDSRTGDQSAQKGTGNTPRTQNTYMVACVHNEQRSRDVPRRSSCHLEPGWEEGTFWEHLGQSWLETMTAKRSEAGWSRESGQRDQRRSLVALSNGKAWGSQKPRGAKRETRV